MYRINVLMKPSFLLLLIAFLLVVQSCKKEKTATGSCRQVTDTIYNPAHDTSVYFKRTGIKAYDDQDRLTSYRLLDSIAFAGDTTAAINRYDITYSRNSVTITDSLHPSPVLSIQLNDYNLPVSSSSGSFTRWYHYNSINEIQTVTDTADGIPSGWTITYFKGGVTEMHYASADSSVPKLHYTFTYFTGIERPHTIIGEILSDPRALVDFSAPEKCAELFSRYLLQSWSDGIRQVVFNYEFNASKFPSKRYSSTGEVISYGYQCP